MTHDAHDEIAGEQTMAHNPYEMMISLSLDGLLDANETNELQEHLRECTTCASLHDRMRHIDAMFSTAQHVMPPVNLTAGVMMRVERYENTRRWYPLLIGVLVVVSLITALTVIGPVMFFALGLHETWPLTAVVFDALAAVRTAFIFGSSAVTGWVEFIVSDPVSLTVVVAALALASTWIGILEGFKIARTDGAAQHA